MLFHVSLLFNFFSFSFLMSIYCFYASPQILCTKLNQIQANVLPSKVWTIFFSRVLISCVLYSAFPMVRHVKIVVFVTTRTIHNSIFVRWHYINLIEDTRTSNILYATKWINYKVWHKQPPHTLKHIIIKYLSCFVVFHKIKWKQFHWNTLSQHFLAITMQRVVKINEKHRQQNV